MVEIEGDVKSGRAPIFISKIKDQIEKERQLPGRAAAAVVVVQARAPLVSSPTIPLSLCDRKTRIFALSHWQTRGFALITLLVVLVFLASLTPMKI